MGRYEIVGAEELIVGAGGWGSVDEVLSGYDIIGAQQRHAMTPHRGGHPGHFGVPPHMAYAAEAAMARGAVAVREQAPTKARRLVLPMQSTGTIAASTAATITARPQTIAFKPQRVVIPATIAPDFLILDIKVGNKSQLVQSGALPAEAFIPTLFDGEMEMDTVQTSQDFVMSVQNQALVARSFIAAVYGKSIDQ